MGVAQLFDIGRGAGDCHCIGMVEAMADGDGPGLHARDLAIHHRFAQQRDDALQRADPAQAFGAERRLAPAHRFGPGEGADDRRDGFGQYVRRGAAGLVDHREQGRAALDVARLQRVAGQARLAQKAVDCRIGRIGGRAFQLLAHRRRLLGQVARDQGQAARRRIGDQRTGLETSLVQLGGEQAGEILARLVLHPRGNFFGAEFEEEVAHRLHSGYLALQSGFMWSIYASQLPFARSRTRPI